MKTRPVAPPAPIFAIPVRIYYEDTDAGGVVYYANYLKYLERCRTEWLRNLGVDQSALLRDPGIAFVVRHVDVDYHRPARLDDALTVDLAVARLGHAQICFEQHVRRDDEHAPLLSARVQVACVDAARMRPTALPPSLRSRLETPQ